MWAKIEGFKVMTNRILQPEYLAEGDNRNFDRDQFSTNETNVYDSVTLDEFVVD